MAPTSSTASTTFSERLGVPWWAWPLGLALTSFAALELTMGAPGLRSPITYGVAALLAIAAVAALGRIRIAVTGGELRVDDARLPLECVAGVTVVDAAARRDLLGVDAEPLAFVIMRPWVAGGVRVDLDDPADPTPYWFISSRRPAQLAAALSAASPRPGASG